MKKWLALLIGGLLLQPTPTRVTAQAPAIKTVTEAEAKTGPPQRTAWGEPDLEGIWSYDFSTPMQRPAKYGNREFLTEAERAEEDKARAGRPITGEVRQGIPLQDLGAAYNAVFRTGFRPTGRRTSLIVDPPDGRIPPYTPEAQKRRGAILEFENALLQATEICKRNLVGCSGWQYGPPSPRRFETPPYYITLTARNGGSGGAINRADGPEDRTLLERCMSGGLPGSGGVSRIVQSRGAVSIFYEMGQGQGFQRVIPITDAPHLPATVRQWWGDSRGRWEGETLVVDVTNFNAKREYQGSRETFHLIERFTRLDANTLEYQATIDDPTTWTKPWTWKQEWTRQDERANRIYYEPRCHEGNYGLVGALVGARADERAFAEGRGPDPATICFGNCGNAVDEVAEAEAAR